MLVSGIGGSWEQAGQRHGVVAGHMRVSGIGGCALKSQPWEFITVAFTMLKRQKELIEALRWWLQSKQEKGVISHP
ncbi:hypothetical protein Btru_062426 [Bulinus truncatus]|nr:hypothetical protein Btru_062426 [Bulinus truncatus]